MQARFLLGPAGSGKTFHCLREIRAELHARPAGAPLILLAPKQSTFQLERQLLENPREPGEPALPGFTRLQILSFDRLARFVLDEFSRSPPELLSEEGRVMVLRALLGRRQADLEIFRSTARMPGFSLQLSLLLRELQHHQVSPEHLLKLADEAAAGRGSLRGKLRDLSLILREYLDWLAKHGLEDVNRLLDLAADLLRSKSASPDADAPFSFGGLWLDGFAEMTPQELNLLAATVPHCASATLAFCLEAEPREDQSRLSIWSGVAATFRACRLRIAAIPACDVSYQIIRRGHGRFENAPDLARLEASWAAPTATRSPEPGLHSNQTDSTSSDTTAAAIRLVSCPDPETEALMAAREILRHVRDREGRYREVAILLRSLDGHADALRSVLNRFGIPYFLDQREPVAHHPLAELTRCALRMASFGWRNEDWFGALKTGLALAGHDEIDRLENEALANGWMGRHWLETPGAANEGDVLNSPERLIQRIARPFRELSIAVSGPPGGGTLSLNGLEMARAIRRLWKQLEVAQTLEKWSQVKSAMSGHEPSVIHGTVWNQMNGWLDNLEQAFLQDPLTLREWLPVVETGLASLTVGVVPPAIDQVLIGTIDRSRNPELRLVLLLGVNEGVFPAPPPPRQLLTEIERDVLADQGAWLGADRWQRLAHERFYGYIACTRPSDRLVVSFSERDARGEKLNPSPFIGHIQGIFPGQQIESELPHRQWIESEHVWELTGPVVRHRNVSAPPWSELAALPALAPVVARRRAFDASQLNPSVSPANAVRLYGAEFKTSVSALEDYSACPFKFFVARGMRADERKKFEADPRERGSFQHEILDRFHRQLRAEGRAWRDLTPAEAQQRIRHVGSELLQTFKNGLFLRTEANRFAAGTLIESLERLVGVLIGWMPQYGFEPTEVELGFGFDQSQIPGWRMELENGHAMVLRGRVDRVDLHRSPDGNEALMVVMDYKSSQRELDKVKLHHGLQLQLLSYLGALASLADPRPVFGVSRLDPVGAFYVDLKGVFKPAKTRGETLTSQVKAGESPYLHRGRFDGSQLALFDNRGGIKGDQFKYSKNKNGQFSADPGDAVIPEEFRELIAQVEGVLQRIGRELYEGRAEVSPFQLKSEKACDQCDFRAVCRFDPWVDAYRILRLPPKSMAPASE